MRAALECRLILVDGHASLFRFHYAYGGVLSTSAGENTSIAYGFLKQILRLLKDLNPPATHMVVVFDAAGKTFSGIGYVDEPVSLSRLVDSDFTQRSACGCLEPLVCCSSPRSSEAW